jgi:hypothetical protein
MFIDMYMRELPSTALYAAAKTWSVIATVLSVCAAAIYAMPNTHIYTGLCTIATPTYLPLPSLIPVHRALFFQARGIKHAVKKSAEKREKNFESKKSYFIIALNARGQRMNFFLCEYTVYVRSAKQRAQFLLFLRCLNNLTAAGNRSQLGCRAAQWRQIIANAHAHRAFIFFVFRPPNRKQILMKLPSLPFCLPISKFVKIDSKMETFL